MGYALLNAQSSFKKNSKWIAALLLFLCVLASSALLILLSWNYMHYNVLTNDAQLARRLVCYYSPPTHKSFNDLRLEEVNGNICTHINVGIAEVSNNTVALTSTLERVLRADVPKLRAQNADLKVLLWIGGGGTSEGFPHMVKNHSNRKEFIRSIKQILRDYKLDGIDLDWEFPSAYNKERQHFSQLLYEIRQEYKRERRDYLLTVAVAAPEGIALFAYDVNVINNYADFVSLMTYDYHFYTRGTPFTGLNAPLYARHKEKSIMSTLNINYSVNWWLSQGLDRSKLVVGLPTYGHSFTLVNPLNKAIGAPAKGYGACGNAGFASYTEICAFIARNIFISYFYDKASCSPYLTCGEDWISYENENSLKCKTEYVKANNLGGVMVFSLNTDDFKGLCNAIATSATGAENYIKFPLISTVRSVLNN